MRAEHFSRVESLFDAALAVPTAGRLASLDGQCTDTDVRADVRALLDAHDRLAAESPPPAAGPMRLRPGTRLGAYCLVDAVGAGGMGEVYRAVRADGAFDRDVAVKVLRAVNDGPQALARFLRERQILASLDHPGIVTLLDGGVTAEGLAYFVMEHVDGVPLSRHCADRHLPLAERLALLRRVCEAVEYAHQRAIVHRDLKPANVLVTPDGQSKVLDFGVATLLAGGGAADLTRELLTAPLTPNYASPEQLRGLPVTTASDVYSLGVLLYEVVAGDRPYDTTGLTLDRVLEVVVTTEPEAPSRRLGLRALGRPAFTGRHLRGDLDAIVQKALRKDPAERYASPRDLAEDLARWSRREPVTARPPSLGYLSRRFVARHRAAVSGAVAAALLVVAALGTAVWQWQVARQEQARAERRFGDVRQLATRVMFDYQEALRLLRGASDLRARMAADSLAYLDALSAERADDDVRLETARGYLATAEVQGSTRSTSIGDSAGALASLARARAILDDLAASRPLSSSAADVRAQFGCVASRIDVAHAQAHARACLDALTPRAAGRPADDLVVQRLGDAHLLLVESGDLSHAPAALGIFAPLLDHPTAGRRARLTTGLLHRLQGRAALDRGDMALALRHGEEARAVVASIVDAEPLMMRMEQSFTLQVIGRAELGLGHVSRGRAALEEAVALARDAYRDNPNDAFVQDRVVLAWFELATALDGIDRVATARAAADAAALLPSLTLALPSPQRDRARGFLLAAHARLGFAVPPCDLVDRAYGHFERARSSGPPRPRVAEYVAWTTATHAGCAAHP